MFRTLSVRRLSAITAALVVGAAWPGLTMLRAQTPADVDPLSPVPAVEVLDDPVHIDELAAYLQTVSNSLCWEMHRFHREQPEFAEAYRPAKEVWSLAGGLRDELRMGPVSAQSLTSRVLKMNELFAKVEKITSGWGDGMRPTPVPLEPRGVVVTPGAGVDLDIPFVGGFRVGTPRVFIPDDAPPVLDRRRLHPNSRGSKRALERELFGVRVALNYLMEDSGIAPAEAGPTGPQPSPPPEPEGPKLTPPVKIGPRAAKPIEPVKK